MLPGRSLNVISHFLHTSFTVAQSHTIPRAAWVRDCAPPVFSRTQQSVSIWSHPFILLSQSQVVICSEERLPYVRQESLGWYEPIRGQKTVGENREECCSLLMRQGWLVNDTPHPLNILVLFLSVSTGEHMDELKPMLNSWVLIRVYLRSVYFLVIGNQRCFQPVKLVQRMTSLRLNNKLLYQESPYYASILCMHTSLTNTSCYFSIRDGSYPNRQPSEFANIPWPITGRREMNWMKWEWVGLSIYIFELGAQTHSNLTNKFSHTSKL